MERTAEHPTAPDAAISSGGAPDGGTSRGGRRWLRLVLMLAPVVAFVGLLVVATVRAGGPPQPGDMAPSFEAELLEGGGTLALDDLRGRPVVLNFWASWCAPCEDEAPMLRDAWERFGDRVAFVGVNIKDARSEALAFDERHRLGYPDVRDEGGAIFADFGLTGQPETFVIDARGEIVEHINGPIPDNATLESMLADLVSQ